MGKTIINVAITMADDEWDRFDNIFNRGSIIELQLIENAIENVLSDELGIISKAKVTKIE